MISYDYKAKYKNIYMVGPWEAFVNKVRVDGVRTKGMKIESQISFFIENWKHSINTRYDPLKSVSFTFNKPISRDIQRIENSAACG